MKKILLYLVLLIVPFEVCNAKQKEAETIIKKINGWTYFNSHNLLNIQIDEKFFETTPIDEGWYYFNGSGDGDFIDTPCYIYPIAKIMNTKEPGGEILVYDITSCEHLLPKSKNKMKTSEDFAKFLTKTSNHENVLDFDVNEKKHLTFLIYLPTDNPARTQSIKNIKKIITSFIKYV